MLTTEAFDALTNDEKRAYFGRIVAAKDAEIARLKRIIDAERDMQAKLVAEGTRLSAEIAKLGAALAKEREACYAFWASGTKTWRAGADLTKTIHDDAFWNAWDDYSARRAAALERGTT